MPYDLTGSLMCEGGSPPGEMIRRDTITLRSGDRSTHQLTLAMLFYRRFPAGATQSVMKTVIRFYLFYFYFFDYLGFYAECESARLGHKLIAD